MKRMGKFVAMGLLLSMLFTVTTLIYKTVSQRYIVDPDFPSYRTEFVDAWGWPLDFVVDDPKKPNTNRIGFEDKFLFQAFLINWVFFATLYFMVVGIFFVAIRLYRRLVLKQNA